MTHDPEITTPIPEPAHEAQASGVREAIVRVVEPVVAAHRCELVDLEYRREPVGWVLRVYVERVGHDPRNRIGGVGLDECVHISRDLSTALDVADLVAHHYQLEVSSPGLERPLTKAQDYRRFTGLRAKLRLHDPIDLPAHGAPRRAFRGEILSVTEPGDAFVLRDDEVGEIELPLARVAKSHLVYDPPPKVKPGKKGAPGTPKNAGAGKKHKMSPRRDGEQSAPPQGRGASENDR